MTTLEKKLAAKALHDIAIGEGDTLKANQYAQFIIEDIAAAAESQKRVSQLNELFQQHLQWEQERAEAEKQQVARLRRNRMIVVVCVLVAVAALLAWLLIRRKMKQQSDEASQQNGGRTRGASIGESVDVGEAETEQPGAARAEGLDAATGGQRCAETGGASGVVQRRAYLSPHHGAGE